MGTMAVMSPTKGDEKVSWDPKNAAEVESAQASFDFLTKEQGYMAYSVDKTGKKGTQLKKFDKDAGQIILAPALVGG